MCVVSMTGDYFDQRWHKEYPWITPSVPSSPYVFLPPTAPSKEEFDKLKLEVEVLKGLLARSKEYDEKNGEPDCEMDKKMKFLKEVAKLVGVDLDEVLKNKQEGK